MAITNIFAHKLNRCMGRVHVCVQIRHNLAFFVSISQSNCRLLRIKHIHSKNN